MRRRTPSGAPPGRRNTQRGRTVWRTSGIGRRMLCPPADDAHGVPARCGKRVRRAVRVSAARERHAGRHRGARDEPRARVVGGRGAGGGDGPRPDHDDACDALLGGEIADVGGSVGDGARDADGDVGGAAALDGGGRGAGAAQGDVGPRAGVDDKRDARRGRTRSRARRGRRSARRGGSARRRPRRRARRGAGHRGAGAADGGAGKGAVGVVIRNTHHTYDGPSVNRAAPGFPDGRPPAPPRAGPRGDIRDRTRRRQPGHERRRRAPRGRLAVDRLARDVGQGAGPRVARDREDRPPRGGGLATAPTRPPAPCAPAPRGPSPSSSPT